MGQTGTKYKYDMLSEMVSNVYNKRIDEAQAALDELRAYDPEPLLRDWRRACLALIHQKLEVVATGGNIDGWFVDYRPFPTRPDLKIEKHRLTSAKEKVDRLKEERDRVLLFVPGMKADAEGYVELNSYDFKRLGLKS